MPVNAPPPSLSPLQPPSSAPEQPPLSSSSNSGGGSGNDASATEAADATQELAGDSSSDAGMGGVIAGAATAGVVVLGLGCLFFAFYIRKKGWLTKEPTELQWHVTSPEETVAKAPVHDVKPNAPRRSGSGKAVDEWI